MTPGSPLDVVQNRSERLARVDVALMHWQPSWPVKLLDAVAMVGWEDAVYRRRVWTQLLLTYILQDLLASFHTLYLLCVRDVLYLFWLK